MATLARRRIRRAPRRGELITTGFLREVRDAAAEPIPEIGGVRSPRRASIATAEQATDQITNPAPDPSTAELWAEVGKTGATVRVENPDDTDQYVDVWRRNTSTFFRADGSRVILIFDNTGIP